MDETSSKRSGGFGFSRRSFNLSFKGPSNEDRNIRHCNRIGCSTRLNSMEGTPVGSPEKSKHPKIPFHSMSSKSVGGSSSKPFVTPTNVRRSHQQQPNRVSSQDTDLPDSEDLGLPMAQRVSTCTTESSSSRLYNHISRWVGPNSQDIASSCSSVRRPNATINTGQFTKQKNLSCSTKRVSSTRKRPSNGESLSSVGKNMSGSSSSCLSGTKLTPQQALRRPKNKPSSRKCPVSVRTRALGTETRMRSPEQQDDNNPHARLTIPEDGSESTMISFTTESSTIFPSSFCRQPRSSSQSSQNMLISSQLEDGPFRERNGYRHVNMEGVAEVLLALERIEQDDELTYEQFLVLEMDLLFRGFSFHDQHRDMRLDIDNMTYEELLALEEKMGTVSTALSDEALLKCVKKGSYIFASRGDEDIKCSICQEEYVIGDEVGKLACNHNYHVDCIQQWLRQKNFCPICKTTAASHAEETRV